MVTVPRRACGHKDELKLEAVAPTVQWDEVSDGHEFQKPVPELGVPMVRAGMVSSTEARINRPDAPIWEEAVPGA